MFNVRYIKLSALLFLLAPFLFPIEAKGQPCDGSGGVIPCECNTGDYFVKFLGIINGRFAYDVIANALALNKLNHVEFTLERGLTASGQGINQSGPGEGGIGSFSFAKNVAQVSVATATPQFGQAIAPILLTVAGAGSGAASVGVHIKAGNRESFCKNLDGPTIGLPAGAVVPANQVINLGGVDYCVALNPNTGCPKPNSAPCECGTMNCLALDDTLQITSVGQGGSDVFKFFTTTSSDQRCPIGKLSAGLNSCQWITLGGVPYGPICF